MVKIKEFKWKPNPLLKNCKYIKVEALINNARERKGDIKTWGFKPRFEESLIESQEVGDHKILSFLDKNMKEIKVSIEELKKYDYVKEQRPELCKEKNDPTKKKVVKKEVKSPYDFDEKEFYNRYKGKITCAYEKDIFIDEGGKERCGAKRTQEREKYIFNELTDDAVLIEVPKDCLPIEYEKLVKVNDEEKTATPEQIKSWVQQTYENAKHHKVEGCIVSHGGTSPYFYAFGFDNLIEGKEKECKKEFANLIAPEEARDFLDLSNLGSTLIPIINRPHWKKKKYGGAIHKVIEGKTPDKQRNRIPEIVLQRVFNTARPDFPQVKDYGDSDINSIPITSVIAMSGMKKKGNEYYGSNVWHGSSGGMNFWINPSKNVWHCFRCNVGGGVAKAIALNKQIIGSCDEELSPDQFKQVLEIAREDYGLKKPEPKESTEPAFDTREHTTSTNKHYTFIKYGKFGPYVDVDAVVEAIRDEEDLKTIYGKRNDVIFSYDGKIWKSGGREIIETQSEMLLQKWAKVKPIHEILKKVKRQTSIDKEEFEKTDLNLIPLNNGVFNIGGKKIQEHSPKYNFRFSLPIEYDKDAECPNFLKFINEVVYPEDIKLIQEWFGFQLRREHFIKKALIIKGPQDTGKSVLLDILTYFVGEKNKTGIPLQKITSGNDFTKLSLKDKHSNIYDDLSSKDLSDGGGLKMATGGGYISGEEKFGEYSQFKPFAKHTYATNKIPSVKDNDDLAYFGRWMITNFDNVPEKIDNFLRDKILNPKEMSGVFNWALEGLYRLLENGKFSYNKSPAETKKIMELSGDILIQFGEDVLEKTEKGRVSKDMMYEVYSKWANSFTPPKPLLSKEQLGRNLNQKVTYIIPKKDKERFWANVEINDIWKQNLEKEDNTDTLDTIQKTLNRNQVITTHTCKDENKVSKTSNNDKDTLDTSSEDDTKYISCFNCNKIQKDGSFIGDDNKTYCPKCFKELKISDREVQFWHPQCRDTKDKDREWTKEQILEVVNKNRHSTTDDFKKDISEAFK